MNERWCSACGKKFFPRAQSPNQAYCSEAQCQAARKLLWQKTKRRSDKDYAANQSKAHAAWVKRNPDYWKNYRGSRGDGSCSLIDVAAAISQALMKICEYASSPKRMKAKRAAPREPSLDIDCSQSSGGFITCTLKIEMCAQAQASSSPAAQETT